jgi:dolichol kinase
MALQLHRGGRFRGWLGHSLGGDDELGNRAWRRIMHALGAAVLVYYVIPTDFFVIAPKADFLLAALAAAFVLEALRHTVGLELPTVREYEEHRVASFVFYSLALVLAVLLFPEPIGAAVVLGTAIVDPIAGELRGRGLSAFLTVGTPLVVYWFLALMGLAAVGRWPLLDSAALAAVAAPIAVAAERPKWPWVDDDLVMTLVPAVFLYVAGVVALGLPG